MKTGLATATVLYGNKTGMPKQIKPIGYEEMALNWIILNINNMVRSTDSFKKLIILKIVPF